MAADKAMPKKKNSPNREVLSLVVDPVKLTGNPIVSLAARSPFVATLRAGRESL